MKALLLVVGCAFMAAAAVAQGPSAVTRGQMLTTANGSRLGPVYRVSADGSAQIIIDGKIVTIPAATLSSADGKLITSLSKNDVSDLR